MEKHGGERQDGAGSWGHTTGGSRECRTQGKEQPLGTPGLGPTPVDTNLEEFTLVEQAVVALLAALAARLGIDPTQMSAPAQLRASGANTRPVWVQLSWLDSSGTLSVVAASESSST